LRGDASFAIRGDNSNKAKIKNIKKIQFLRESIVMIN